LGVLKRTGHGKYSLGMQKDFQPELSKEIKELYKTIKAEYPYLEISIWSTEWIIPWLLHIPGNHETIIEVEKGAEDNVFYYLNESNDNVFVHPTSELLSKYAKSSIPLIIIRNLITDAPLQIVQSVQIPSLEKLVVDLIVGDEILSKFQGRDLESILENVFGTYTINMDKLLRYAGRKRKKEFVHNYITTHQSS